MSRSPSGIQAASPLQRAWMICEWKGSRRSNAATVRGARSRSSSPVNENGPAVIFSIASPRSGAAAARAARGTPPARAAACGRRAAQPAADVGRELVAVGQVLRGQRVLGGEDDECEVGVRPDRDAPLAGDA